MDLDTAYFQLIFNVIAITAIASLAAMCYFLQRDKQELLAGKRPPAHKQEPQLPKSPASPPPDVSKPQPSPPQQYAMPQRAVDRPLASQAPPRPHALPPPEAARSTNTDICRFVTQRAQGWVAPSESQWKTP